MVAREAAAPTTDTDTNVFLKSVKKDSLVLGREVSMMEIFYSTYFFDKSVSTDIPRQITSQNSAQASNVCCLVGVSYHSDKRTGTAYIFYFPHRDPTARVCASAHNILPHRACFKLVRLHRNIHKNIKIPSEITKSNTKESP